MSNNSMQAFRDSSFFNGGSAAYLEQLYESFLQAPNSVPVEWRTCFQTLQQNNAEISHAAIRDEMKRLAQSPIRTSSRVVDKTVLIEQERKQARVLELITAYRCYGHREAQLDPLSLRKREPVFSLVPDFHQLTEANMTEIFSVGSVTAMNDAALKDILSYLKKTYCGSIGLEYMHISSTTQRVWLQERFEQTQGQYNYSAAKKQRILNNLLAAEGLEKYLGRQYVGQKRFSLEGGDSLIPALDLLIQHAGELGMKDVVLGMAHRGRLNVLVNILGKSPENLFGEFEGKADLGDGSGDVKYHMGFSSNVPTPGGPVHLALAFNPSHLEIIGPVVEGSVCARQRKRQDTKRQQVLPVVIHGDAAFAGQGVVMETFNFSQSRGYCTGGTIHIVINNQIGFTTSNPLDSRSTLYCTDVAKMVQAPIFHVNGDDPEAVVFATELALDYRHRFNKDVVIDIVCYRRHGHNEADEPAATQPRMYQKIRQHPSPLKRYSEQLIQEQLMTQAQIDDAIAGYQESLKAGQAVVALLPKRQDQYAANWSPYLNQNWRAPATTSISQTKLKKLGQNLVQLPDEFKLQKQVAREYDNRKKMYTGELALNWGAAETLAYATLLSEGYVVRLSGQDSGRGTFAHRHAVLHNQNDGECYLPLQNVAAQQGAFKVIDSVLSEEAVLAFEYGFATAEPEGLIIWEAQFGDFANGAQVVIDQFISSGEQKWGRLCSLVMMLPHGYEGQGPEHSSARLERFLQLCAEENMQVCIPTTPAQIFHLLRRQVLRPFRTPLIIMSPKSLLRHKAAVSTLKSLADGEFQLVIADELVQQADTIKRVILCSGKVYYDLLQQREQHNKTDVAIIRIEQLYPFPTEEVQAELAKFTQAKVVIWCQEEPKNQGAWFSSQHHIKECLADQQELFYAGRAFSASPAVGQAKIHALQQLDLVYKALDIKA